MAEALQSQVDLLGGLYQWSDFESRKSVYKDRLSSPIAISMHLPDLFAGVLPRRQVEVRVKDVATQDGLTGGTIDMMPGNPNSEVTLADLTAGQDIYGTAITARLYDLDSGLAYLTLTGVIADLDAGSGALTIQNLDFTALSTDVPKRRLIDLYSGIDLSTAPHADPRVIKVFKEARQVRLTKVSTAGGNYDYGAIVTPASGSHTLVTVYRGKSVVPSSQYSLVESIPGLYVVRFTRAQVDPSGRELEIRVDLTSTEYATHADCAKWLFGDALDGLGKMVNASAFSAAAAVLSGASYAPGGWIGPEPWKAEDVAKGLAVRGSVFEVNSAGEVIMTVDAAALHTAAQYNGRAYGLGRGDNHWENVKSVTSYKQRKSEDRVREYVMQSLYTESFGESGGAYLLQARASRNVDGKTLDPVNTRFIGDLNTLKNECGYRLARMAAAEQSLTLEVINEGRAIGLNQTVPVVIPGKRINASSPPLPWMCVGIAGKRDDWTLELEGYDSGMYSATAAVGITASGANVLTDYTYTAPQIAPTLGTITFETVLADDGSQEIVIVIPATASAETQITALLYQVFHNNNSTVLHQKYEPCVAGDTKTVKIGPLAPGKSYDVSVFGFAGNNAPGSQVGIGASSTNKVAPNAPGAPAQVTGLTLVAQPPRAIRADWNDLSDTTFNLWYYEVQTATDSGFTTAVRTRRARTSELVIGGLTNGTTYFVRVRAVNKSRQPGTYSSTMSLTVSRTVTDDIGDGTITGGSGAGAKLAALTVTNANINDLSAAKITTGTLTVANASGAAEILVKGGASVAYVRIQNSDTTPSEIRFETAGAVVKSKISGNNAGNLRILPGTDNNVDLEIGAAGARWANLSLASAGQTTITSNSGQSVLTVDAGDIFNTGNNAGDFYIRDFDAIRIRGDFAVNAAANGVLASWKLRVEDNSGTFLGYLPLMTG